MTRLPGPRSRYPGEHLLALTRRPLQFLPDLARQWGDVASFSAGGQLMVVASHPDLVRDVLVTNARSFHKGRGLERTKILLGEGLLTSEGEFHLRQRRLAQPAFHRPRIAAYGEIMSSYAERRASTWCSGDTIDLLHEMAAYTLAVVGKTLFDADIEHDAQTIGEALGAAIDAFNFTVLPFGEKLLHLPIPAARRFRDGRAQLDAIIYRLIAERRAANDDRGDLLSMLLLAQDTEGEGGGMTDRQLRDEAMTLLLAGHETTSNALTWAFYLLSQHPAVEASLLAELEAIGDVPLGAGHMAQLPYARAVIAETLRLYPPAWVIGRRAMEEYQLGEYSIPARTIVITSQWIMHRDPRGWPEAERFMPERWMTGGTAMDPARPKFSYFPFGAGTRVCIGEQFAWMEGVLALATIARRWRLRLAEGHRVEPRAVITLRPRHGMRMVAETR